MKGASIHPSATIIAKELVLGRDVSIGADVVIGGDRVQIGSGTSIGAGVSLRAARIEIGEGCEIEGPASILVAEEFLLGSASRLSRGAEITCRRFEAGKFLYLGHECVVGYGGVTARTATCVLGSHVALGPHNILNANCAIVLENKVGSGSYVTFWTHGFHFGHSALDGFPPVFEPIRVRTNVWLGYHVTVLPGVTVGENSIIAAGAVVAKDIPANVLAGGVPAQVKRPLALNRRSPDQCDDFLASSLAAWAEELEWKGGNVERLSSHELRVRAPRSQESVDVVHCPIGVPAEVALDSDSRRIVVRVDVQDDLRSQLPEGWTLFEVDAGRFSGRSDDIAEDLRDYLRRRTLVCGDDRVYRSIEPEAFRRLRELG